MFPPGNSALGRSSCPLTFLPLIPQSPATGSPQHPHLCPVPALDRGHGLDGPQQQLPCPLPSVSSPREALA